MKKKKIVFITETRPDYGKIRSLMSNELRNDSKFEVYIFVTGMHLQQNMAIHMKKF